MKGCLLAVDLGTTSIVASLIDGMSGERLATGFTLNPQRAFGADVVTRIAAAVKSESARHEMASLVNAELETLALHMLADSGVTAESLRRVAIAGNPAIEHLLLDLPVDSLARVPFRPLFTEGKMLRTTGIGWSINTELFVFPLPGGFVGGDLVAFLYGESHAASPASSHASRLFLDLGTNAEIALVSAGVVYATSAAAGPAFEGGTLSSGMPALAGGINSVTIHGDTVAFTTIENAVPTGICGTGALSAVASLLEAGLVDSFGRILQPVEIPSNLANRIIIRDGAPAFQIYRDAQREIVLSQRDIREIQLAKGAIRGGVEVLLAKGGVTGYDLDDIVVSGAFGFSITGECLEQVGFIPEGTAGRVAFIPNGVLAGVERFHLNPEGADEVNALSAGIKMQPLSGNPVFERLFMNHMGIGPAR